MPRPEALTERQEQILEFLSGYIETHGIPPTLKTIAAANGYRSVTGVVKVLKALQQKGHIERTENQARSIRLTSSISQRPRGRRRSVRLSVIEPPPAEYSDELRNESLGTIDFDLGRFLKYEKKNCIVAEAGDSGMERAGILRGDWLVIEEKAQMMIRPGDVVAVLTSEKLIARIFEPRGAQIALLPDAGRFKEQTYHKDDLGYYLVGPVVAVIRRLSLPDDEEE
ncbi:MAG: S24 family peptidase [Bacteroidota bacterium]